MGEGGGPTSTSRPGGPRRRRVRAVIGLLAVVLVVACGGYVWSQLWFGGSTTAVPGTPYVLRVQQDRPGDVANVRHGLELADAFVRDEMHSALTGPVEVRLAARTPCVPFAFGGTAPTAVAEDGSLCLDVDGPVWTQNREDDPAVLRSIVVHESYHVLQAELGCLPGPDEHTHAWLVEGAATWVGWQALVAAGEVSQERVDSTLAQWREGASGPVVLAEHERQAGSDPEYAVAYEAVDRLVAAGGGPQALIEFCSGVGSGTSWHTAFEEAFGVSVDDFYADAAGRGDR